MSYLNAPATKMIDARCAVCSRELLDAVSVEVGMGPICRERHGYQEVEDASEEARAEANKIVRAIAAAWQDEDERLRGCVALRLLGFSKLAERIEYRGKDAPRAEAIEVTTGYGELRVKSPFKPAAVAAFRTIRGRRWDGMHKLNVVPEQSKRDLWRVLRECFAGVAIVVDGEPKGVIPAA